jgi:DNA-binding XRE family transcriptional regulator
MAGYYKVDAAFREFCKQMGDVRVEKGMQQAQVADAIGGVQTNISAIERADFGESIRDTIYARVRAYAKLLDLPQPTLPLTAKRQRGVRTAQAPAVRKPSAEAPALSILRLVADGTLSTEKALEVIRALISAAQ